MSCFNKNEYNILTLLFILTLLNPLVISSRLFERHEEWMEEHGKLYKDAAEKEKRFQIFKENLEFIESFNAAGDNGFNLSINQFADQTNEEFKASLNGQKKLLKIATKTKFKYENVTDVPATMDWRERGAVTPIKNQYECGSCWAFAAVAATEGIHQITTGRLVALSEQELVDCVRGNSAGCSGGFVEDSYEFIVKKGGITSESKYPYKDADKKCNIKKGSHPVAQIKGYEKVPANNEKALLKAVANQPVTVYIQGGAHSFQFYSSGVLSGKCGVTDLYHTATIVGYGINDDGVTYWLVKNSWGTKWGEKGYIKIKRDVQFKQGLCGIAINPTYPIA